MKYYKLLVGYKETYASITRSFELAWVYDNKTKSYLITHEFIKFSTSNEQNNAFYGHIALKSEGKHAFSTSYGILFSTTEEKLVVSISYPCLCLVCVPVCF